MLPEPGYRARRSGFGRVWVLAAVVLLLSVAVVVFVQLRDETEVDPGPRLNTGLGTGDHWHIAFAVYQCDHFVAEPVARGVDWPDPSGIHSDDDAFIHVHPFVASAAGDGARLGVFFETMGLAFTSQSIELTTGTTLRTGDQCNGRPATLKVAEFEVDEVFRLAKIISSDLPVIRLRDRRALTIALVADDTAIPPPPHVSLFDELTAVDGLRTTTRR